MSEQTESERKLGELAQQILDRIVTDRDFRQCFLNTSAELVGETGEPDGGDVMGYSMPHNPLVDPMSIFANVDVALPEPLRVWLEVCQNMGLLRTDHNNTSGSGPAKGAPRQPKTMLPASGGPKYS